MSTLLIVTAMSNRQLVDSLDSFIATPTTRSIARRVSSLMATAIISRSLTTKYDHMIVADNLQTGYDLTEILRKLIVTGGQIDEDALLEPHEVNITVQRGKIVRVTPKNLGAAR